MADGPPLVTVAVPSAGHGRYLGDALASVFAAGAPVEVFVADAGSQDETRAVIESWAPRLAGWRSQPDRGQAAAINEAIGWGSAPLVTWLNSDDRLLPGSLGALAAALETLPGAPGAYGRVWNVGPGLERRSRVWVQPFSEFWLANRCIISQPGTLVRRTAWEAVGGVAENLEMAFDYDLWWRLYRRFGRLHYVRRDVGENRVHPGTKTLTRRRQHYLEAFGVVRRHRGSVPLRWWLWWPWAVWVRSRLYAQRP